MSRALITTAEDLATGRPYVERSDPELRFHDRAAEFLLATLLKPTLGWLRDPARGLKEVIELANRHNQALRSASDNQIAAQAKAMRPRLRRDGFTLPLVGECFALVREAASRTIGQRHYDAQLMAGWGLLQGKLIEMETGEGKTIAATLPASTVALAGYPVHVITVNDYLVSRDAEEMGPLYRFLGLSVGTITQGMQRPARQQAYSKSITYCTNKELAFDYLRDRVAVQRRGSRLHLSLEKLRGQQTRDEDLVLRGLYFGIVDEADSVLVDEARTPLILSSKSDTSQEKQQCEQALDLARRLLAGRHYQIDRVGRTITFSEEGKDELQDLAEPLGGVWSATRPREELVKQALSAILLFGRDQQYVVTDGKVQIVDESTGRVMPDRSWERGLHQLIEVKEGCEPTERRETLARLTYQRLFRRYVRLAGMTGTAREVAREIRLVYGMDIVRIPLHRPSRRTFAATRVCGNAAEKWREVANEVDRLTVATGRPVLIGTRSVKASEEISRVLKERGIEHALLNAKQDKDEAEVIAVAGQPWRVTVATNMAGRGTDIRLGTGIADLGGLHVILTEFHESRRIDRQFFGRCARQGDPGNCQAIVSLEDELYTVYAPLATGLLSWLRKSGRLWQEQHEWLRRLAQFHAERRSAYVRVQNLKQDRQLDGVLAFSGKGE